MRANGFVLLCCLLMTALCSVLILASLQLSRSASQLNQIALQQQRPAVQVQGPAQSEPQQVSCLPSGQIWPAGWQQCSLQSGRLHSQQQADVGFVTEMTTITIPQGGGLE